MDRVFIERRRQEDLEVIYNMIAELDQPGGGVNKVRDVLRDLLVAILIRVNTDYDQEIEITNLKADPRLRNRGIHKPPR